MRSIVVAGDLGFLVDTAEQMGKELPTFMRSYRKLVRRYLHSHPIFTKHLGDQFIYVYEASSAQFSRNVLHSMMVLSGAYEEAVAAKAVGFENIHDALPETHSLRLGMSSGPLFALRRSRDTEDDYIGLPMYAAQQMAEEAGGVSSHILIDPALELDRLCREWLELDEQGVVGLHDLEGAHDQAQIVTPESVLLQFRSDRERYRVVNVAESFKEEIDQVAESNVFSFRLRKGGSPHIELVFNPTNYRGPFDRSQPSSILLVHVSSTTLTLLPEILVPSDRVYTVQIPVRAEQGYQVMFGLAIQSPATDLIQDELRTVVEAEEIVERLEALRRLLKRARLLNKLATAYYRF